MAELSSAEAYIAGPKGREYAAVALDRADSSAKPWAWVTGGRSPACHPSHVAANAGFGAEPQEVRIAHFNSASSARRNRRHAHGILNTDASIQFGIQFFKERRQHCGVETDALTDGNGAYLPERVMSFGAGGRTSYRKDAPLDESRRTSDNAGRGAITRKPASGMRSGDNQ